MTKLLLAATSFVALASAANAATYILSYTDLSANEFGAVLTADLDVDNNTLISIAAVEFTINGVTYPSNTLDSFSNVFAGSGAPATLTLDGTSVDFLISDSTAGAAGNGFGMATGYFGSDSFISSETNTFEAYDVSSFSVTAVPLPAALPLSIAALGGLGLVARRRKAA